MASTLSVQELINPLRTYAEIQALTPNGGFEMEPALTVANSVIQKMLGQPMNWKFNRQNIPLFLTVTLQQDYVTNVTDLGWLEQGWRVDINNTANPKPIPALETVRDISQTSAQGNPFQTSWVPNRLAIQGVWQALTAYGCGYGQASTPISPIQQFVDANGNFLFIDSSSLDLNISSPGYSGTPISTTPPFGTSGAVEPVLPADSAAGTTVVDGTVTWTVADPDGYAIRVAPLPAFSGLCWLMNVVYQKTPPRLTSLSQLLDPIPDNLSYLFQQGFLAHMYQHSPEPSAQRKAPMAIAQWVEDLQFAIAGANREREDACFYPSQSITGSGPFQTPFPIGPAYPYTFYGY